MFNKKGFTLIEIMVASSIFIIVMVISVGAILSVVDGNRKSQALSSVVSNLNIAIESMVRDIRTGTNYSFPPVTPSNSSIKFSNSNGNDTFYSLIVNGNGSISKIVNQGTTANPILQGNITAPEVNINSMTFTPRGVGADSIQPLILLQIKGSVGTGKYTSPFTVQTLISERALEN